VGPLRLSGRTRAVGVSQHPDEHRAENPVLLAVDSSSAKARVFGLPQNSPIRSARSKSGEHQDAEQLGAGTRPEGVQVFPDAAFDVREVHERER
jgi:hypothetical protein